MKTAPAEASPVKTLLEEIELFRAACHGTLDAIGGKLDERIDGIKSRVEALGHADDIAAGKLRDVRDMLTLLHHADVKPEKGRRKDLKKLDTISDDLFMMVEQWS